MNRAKLWCIMQIYAQQELINKISDFPDKIEDFFDDEEINDDVKEVYNFTLINIKNARKRATKNINHYEQMLRKFP